MLAIPCGLKDEKLVYPDDPNLKNGEDCGATCLGCSKRLVLVQPKKRVHHFRHKASEACTVHNQVQEWILRKFSDQVRPHTLHSHDSFLKHPHLIMSRDFMKLRAKKEVWDSKARRRYDIRVDIQINPPLIWEDPDFKHEKTIEQWLLWDVAKRREGNRAGRRNEEITSALSAIDDSSLSEEEQCEMRGFRFGHENFGFFPGPGIDCIFLERIRDAKKVNPYQNGKIMQRMPKEEHTDHILIEVKDKHPKDTAFIEQVRRERRYVFEVDAKKFWNQDKPTLARMFDCGTWLWP